VVLRRRRGAEAAGVVAVSKATRARAPALAT
jgi:hypothetical protein